MAEITITYKDRKRKTEDRPAATADPTTASTFAVDVSSFRNWSNFSEDLLLQIFTRLCFSSPGRLIFSGVCRSWRSIASAAAPFSGPPLLLTPTLNRPRSGTAGPRRWSRPARCRLHTLTDGDRSYGCLVSARTLRRSCVGSSFGQLIFIGGKKAVISDVCSGREVISPSLPPQYQNFSFIYGVLYSFDLGILTAPIDSPSCSLLLASSSSSILCWRQGSDGWSELKLGALVGGKIVSLAVVKGKTFVLLSTPHPFPRLVFVRKFHPYVAWRRIGLPAPNDICMLHTKYDHYLVERGGELLLVVFAATGQNRVYQLDPLSFLWERIESLGNWCLFVHRKQAVACPDPTRWGGQNNCVYFIRPGCGADAWSVVPFDGGVVDTRGDFPFNEESLTMKLFPWPSAIWVYPSMLLENHRDQT